MGAGKASSETLSAKLNPMTSKNIENWYAEGLEQVEKYGPIDEKAYIKKLSQLQREEISHHEGNWLRYPDSN